MSKLTALISIAALAGVGYYVGKKIIKKVQGHRILHFLILRVKLLTMYLHCI